MPKRKCETDAVASPDVKPEDYPGQRAFEGAADLMFANATPPDPLKRKSRKRVRGKKTPSRDSRQDGSGGDRR